jgi:dolichol kinase
MTDLPWVSILLVAGAFLGMLAIGELIHRRWSVEAELTRKLDHVAAGVIALALPLVFGAPAPVFVLAALLLAFLAATRLRGWLGSVHDITRASLGAFAYPVAVAATFLIAHDEIGPYWIAIAALALADAASGLVGTRVGRRAYAAWGQPRTLEGTLAAFVVTTLAAGVILVATGLPPGDAILAGALAGLVVALVEGALPWGLDNLGVPLAAIAALGAAESAAGSVAVLLGAAGLFGLSLVLPRRDRRPIAAGRAPRPATSDAE